MKKILLFNLFLFFHSYLASMDSAHEEDRSSDTFYFQVSVPLANTYNWYSCESFIGQGTKNLNPDVDEYDLLAMGEFTCNIELTISQIHNNFFYDLILRLSPPSDNREIIFENHDFLLPYQDMTFVKISGDAENFIYFGDLLTSLDSSPNYNPSYRKFHMEQSCIETNLGGGIKPYELNFGIGYQGERKETAQEVCDVTLQTGHGAHEIWLRSTMRTCYSLEQNPIVYDLGRPQNSMVQGIFCFHYNNPPPLAQGTLCIEAQGQFMVNERKSCKNQIDINLQVVSRLVSMGKWIRNHIYKYGITINVPLTITMMDDHDDGLAIRCIKTDGRLPQVQVTTKYSRNNGSNFESLTKNFNQEELDSLINLFSPALDGI